MEDFKVCLIVFILVFVLRLSVYILSKKRHGKANITMEMKYLINRFKLNKDLINTLSIVILISIIDSFVISLTLFLALKLSNNIIVEILIAFILVFGLIILCNELIGKILKKKGFDKK